MNFPSELKYSESHEWVKVCANKAVVGISDFAQKELGDIVFVELPEVGKEIKAMNPCCVVESVKTASDIYSPVSGVICSVNSKLTASPELINENCYEDGWIFEVEMTDCAEVNNLLDAQAYQSKYVK